MWKISLRSHSSPLLLPAFCFQVVMGSRQGQTGHSELLLSVGDHPETEPLCGRRRSQWPIFLPMAILLGQLDWLGEKPGQWMALCSLFPGSSGCIQGFYLAVGLDSKICEDHYGFLGVVCACRYTRSLGMIKRQGDLEQRLLSSPRGP